MMDRNINFISAQTQKKISLAKRMKTAVVGLAFLLGTVLIAYCVVVIVLIGQRLTWGKLKRTVSSKENQINEYRQTESSIYIISSRAKVIKETGLKDQNEISKTLELVDKLMNSGFKPKGDLRLGKLDNFEVEGEVSDASALSGVSVLMDELKTKGYFIDYQVNSVQRKAEGGYRLTVNLYMTEKK